MKKTLALILTVFFLLPLLLGSCTQTPQSNETSTPESSTSEAPLPELKQLGLDIDSYSTKDAFNPILDVRYNSLNLSTAFFSSDPERKKFEVEITISLNGCPEPNLEDPFPSNFFHSVSLVSDSEFETKKINGTAIEIDASVLEKLPENTIKGRYSFDLSYIPDKMDYSLEIVLSPKSRSNNKNTIHTIKNAVTIGEKIEFASEKVIELADSKLKEKAADNKYQYYRPDQLRYDYEEDYYYTWFRMYLEKYRTGAAYGAYVDINNKKVTNYEFEDRNNYSYYFDKITKEDILTAENALLTKVNDYLTKEGQKTYTLENAPFWLSCEDGGPLTLETELILPVKEGEYSGCGDHKHAMFSENIYPK